MRETLAKTIDDAGKDNPNSNEQSRIDSFYTDGLQKYSCPDSEKANKVRKMITPKDESVGLYQLLLADVKNANGL
jgi:hypothetical protein